MIYQRVMLILITVMIFWGSVFSQNSQLIPTNHGVIHYKIFGKGKPLVIINGGPGMNSEGFAGLAEQLAKEGFLCIIYDQRGTGKSEMKKVDSTTITMKNMVEDLEVLRKHLKLEKWIVFGQSFGGLLATQYTHTYPKSIEKHIFSNSGGLNMDFLNYVGKRIENNLTQSERDSLQYYNELLIKEPENKYYLQRRAFQLSNAYLYQKVYVPNIAERLLQVKIAINQMVYNDLQKHKYDYVGKFTGFNTPVLIFQGLNDIISLETAKIIQKSFAGSKLVALEKCAHYPWLDSPEIFWQEIVAFLRK